MPRAAARMGRRLTAFAAALLISLTVFTAPAAANPVDSVAEFASNVWDGLTNLLALDAADELAGNATAGADRVADADTMTQWTNWSHETTQNIGRIWTDKTVSTQGMSFGHTDGSQTTTVPIDGSDFLVALSALSSASNTTVTQSVPLDIALVLDASSSMDNPLLDTSNPVFDNGSLEKKSDLYAVEVDGELKSVKYDHDGWYYEGPNWSSVRITPKKSAEDSSGVQFYAVQDKKDAMIDAVDGFIDATAKMNESVADENAQHRVSVISFAKSANSATVEQGMTTCTDSNADSIKRAVSGIDFKQDTYPAVGLESAADQFADNPRADGVQARKVVIFFTDGTPSGTGDSFKDDIAEAAVEEALGLKQGGALIYSVGMFEEANPEDTAQQFNQYMHGVSSNYPEATSFTSLGKPADDPHYYMAAKSSQDLYDIFQKISEELSQGSGVPTETPSGDPAHEGYITFTDQLGDFMKVDGFKSIVFADTNFQNPGMTHVEEADKTTYTYKFTGVAPDKDVYPDGDLQDVIIEVVNYKDVSKGDLVTVKIPASLIPLRYFSVDETDGTMSVKEAYPMRIVYGVSLKDDVATSVADGSFATDHSDYVASHSSASGQVYFLSNAWNGTTIGDAHKGGTTAVFTPAKTNNYYYFAQDTPIYENQGTEEKPYYVRVTGSLDASKTYYYKQTYYKKNGTNAEQVESWAKFSGASTAYAGDAIASNDEGLYFTAGTPRMSYIHEFETEKDSKGEGGQVIVGNKTDTAADVLNPNWDYPEDIDRAENIIQSLGNNGKLSLDLPGSLEISKTVQTAAGHTAPDAATVNFSFTITLKNADDTALSGEFPAQEIKDGEVVSDKEFKLQFTNGTTTTILQAGETLRINGLPAGAEYEVREGAATESDGTAPVKGFTQVKPADNAAATGTITAGTTSAKAEFVNEYKAESAEVDGSAIFKGSKKLTGRDWEQGDKFTFILTGGAGAPMPSKSSVVVDYAKAQEQGEINDGDVVAFDFGNKDDAADKITYTTPGTYEYYVHEQAGDADGRLPGVSYTNAQYKITVEVTDNAGVLKATSKMVQINDAQGNQINPPTEVTNGVAAFENIFNADAVSAAMNGNKVLTDGVTGAPLPLAENQFAFKVTPENGAPVPDGVKLDSDGSYTVRHQENGSIDFLTARYDMQGTFVYKVNEVDGKQAGYTYDNAEYMVEVAVDVTVDAVTGASQTSLTWTYKNANGEVITDADGKPVTSLTFNNTYTPTAATLDADKVIKGTKVLDGRKFKEGETFGFTLTADADTKKAIEAGYITGLTGSDEAKAEKDATTFTFGNNVTFKKAGTYTFTMEEAAWNNTPIKEVANTQGLTFDKTSHTVVVNVEDKGGKLEASVTYDNDATKTSAEFTNVYTATYDYGANSGLKVSKRLDGRAMASGEFTFNIKGVQGIETSAADAEAKLDEADKTFQNAKRDDGVAQVMDKFQKMAFNQDDAGKTFKFELSEKTDGSAKNVAYDSTKYTIAIAVTDNVNGSLSVETTITNDKNTDKITYSGKPADKQAAAFENTYTADSVIDYDTKANLGLNKLFTGRTWTEKDEFSFTVTPKSYTPINGSTITENLDTVMPKTTDPTVKKIDADSNGKASFGIGDLTFTKAGTYVYTIKENVPTEATSDNNYTYKGITYDYRSRDITFVVKDHADEGKLKVDSVKVGNYNTERSRTFTNTYNASTTFGDVVDFSLTKTLYDRNWDSDDFYFTVTANATNEGKANAVSAEDAAKKVGMKSGMSADVRGAGGADGQTVPMLSKTALTFDETDNNKTYSYTFSERNDESKGDNKPGYTYDKTKYTLNITPTDNGDGTMSLAVQVVTTDADGKETARDYNLAEDNDVVLPFVNYYAKDTVVPVTIEGNKKLEGEGLTLGDIANKFTYTLVNADGSELDASRKAEGFDDDPTNAADGKIFFGNLQFSVADLKGVDYDEKTGTRSKTFTYKVKESGTFDGVINGGEQTVTVTLTDDGQGNLKAEASGFTYTNYSIYKSVQKPEGDIKVGDTLTYTINWANATDKAANVVVTDKLSDGLTFVEASDGGVLGSDNVVTWNLGEKQPGATGKVTLKVRVNEKALGVDLNNQATINVGDKSFVTNEIETDHLDGTAMLAFEKGVTVTPNKGLNVAAAQAVPFTFTVTLRDSANIELTGDYAFTGTYTDADGNSVTATEDAPGSIKSGDTIQLKHSQKIKISGLPEGTKYDVVETPVAGFTQTYPIDTDGKPTNLAGTLGKDLDDSAFVNNYDVAEDATLGGADSLKVTKVIDGRAWQDGDSFDFVLSPNTEHAATKAAIDAKNIVLPGNAGKLTIDAATEGHAAAFGNITFKQAGEFEFYITEQSESHDGLTYDTEGKLVKVTVTDEGNGRLSAKVTAGANPTITNTYGSTMPDDEAAHTNPAFTKEIDGRDWLDTDQFTFTMKPVTDGAPMPTDAEGNKVDQVTVTKKNVGEDGKASFSFGTIKFTYDMVKDIGGTSKDFVYEVTENPIAEGVAPGVTRDDSKATLTITVTDNGKGKLTATAKLDGGAFVNTYESALDYNAAGGLAIEKVLNGRDMMKDQFTFDVKAKGEDRLGIAGDYKSPASKNGEPATVATFGSGVKFTQDDAGKEWSYTITERAGKAGKGYTYDDTEYMVTVAVKDNGNSTLTVTTTVASSKGGEPVVTNYTTGDAAPAKGAVVSFVNTYETNTATLGAEGDAQLTASKVLTGRPMTEGEFAFAITNDADGSEVATAKNAAAGDGEKSAVTFGDIVYTSDGLYADAAAGKAEASEADAKTGAITYTYSYTAKETSGEANGVVGVATEFAFKVRVTDNNDGTLSIAVEQPDGGLAFKNTYGTGAEGKTSVNASGKKTLAVPEGEGYTAPNIAGKYEFTLSGVDEAGNPAPMPVSTTAVNDASGNVSFGAIEYTMANVFGPKAAEGDATSESADGSIATASAIRSKTFTYTVTESGKVAGVVNDATVKTFTVTVTDQGNGELTAVTNAGGKTVGNGMQKFEFVNSYEPSAAVLDGDNVIKGTKELKVPEYSKRTLADAEFGFKLTAVTEGAPMPELDEVYNDSMGQFSFGGMMFTKPGAYKYQVSEVDNGLSGVVYDNAVYDVTVTVVNDADAGALVATTTVTKNGGQPVDGIAFTNEYTAIDATLGLTAAKVLEGRELADGEFDFTLTYNDGEGVVKAKNDANGEIAFKALSFSRPGTYTFAIAEAAGKAEGVKYDDHVYKATVTVSETNADGEYDGKLHATVAYEDGAAPVFTNVYTAPEEPVDPVEPGKPDDSDSDGDGGDSLPSTGDGSLSVGVLGAVAVTGAALIGAGGALLKKRNNR